MGETEAAGTLDAAERIAAEAVEFGSAEPVDMGVKAIMVGAAFA